MGGYQQKRGIFIWFSYRSFLLFVRWDYGSYRPGYGQDMEGRGFKLCSSNLSSPITKYDDVVKSEC